MNQETSSYYWWTHYIAAPLALITATILTYYPSLHYDFQFDDIANIPRHFNIRHYSLSQLFFSGTRWISYWLNSLHYKIGKFDPFSYRIGNIVLHSFNGLLVFLVLYFALSRLRNKSFFSDNPLGIALVSMLLFLLHPVQTQTVSYVIQGQLEGFAAFFILSMSLCVLAFGTVHSSSAKSGLAALLCVLAFFSCGTKEIAIISPLLLILIDWFFVAQGEWHSLKKRLWLHGLVMGIVIATYLYLLKPKFFTSILGLQRTAKNNIGNIITKDPAILITPGIFFISQFKVILHYLWMFIWPFGISVEYDWVLCESFFDADCFFPFLGLCVLAALNFYLLKHNNSHPIAFGALWFFMCIAPRSSIIPSPELLVDYKTYTASIGWLFLLASTFIWLATHISAHIKQPAHVLPLLILTPFSMYFTYQRNLVWSSGLAFWGNIIQQAPGKARAYNNYGVDLSQNQKRYAESIPYFQKAIAMDAHYADPRNNLAVAYSHTGDIDSAIEALKGALLVNKYYPEGYNNLASFYLQKKDYSKAEQSLKNALSLRPHYGKAYFNLGRMKIEQNDLEQAAEYFRKCCYEADLDNEVGFGTHAKVCMNLKWYDQAITSYKKVLEHNKHNTEALFNMGNAYFMQKDFAPAIECYMCLSELTPDDPRVWYNLGETYFMSDRYEKALPCFKKMIHKRDEFPHAYLRMAGCYEKMGDIKTCKTWLNDMLLSPAPDDLKKVARGLMAQVDTQYQAT